MITLYGLKNCDTCRRALKDLEAEGAEVTFVDIRSEADLPAKVPAWLKAAGPKALVNSRSTTWKALSDARKEAAKGGDPAVLVAHPTLIKRPVVEEGGRVTVGWPRPGL